MPVVIRGKTGRTCQLLVGRKSYATGYVLNSSQYGSLSCQMRVICSYHKGVKGTHGIQYNLHVVHRVKLALPQMHQHYKNRFGIETSYRIQ